MADFLIFLTLLKSEMRTKRQLVYLALTDGA